MIYLIRLNAGVFIFRRILIDIKKILPLTPIGEILMRSFGREGLVLNIKDVIVDGNSLSGLLSGVDRSFKIPSRQGDAVVARREI